MNEVEHQLLVEKLFCRHAEDMENMKAELSGNFCDRKGNQITDKQWRVLISYQEYVDVKSILINKLHVISYWVGFSHHLFETIVVDKGNFIYIERSKTEQEALRNFEKYCFWIDQKKIKKSKTLKLE